MLQRRRLTAALLCLSLGWTALVLGLVVAPAAQADTPHDPATYYAGTDGLTGAALEAKLHSIVHDHTKLTYDQVWTALQATDRDPNDPDDIIDVYSGASLVASNMCNTGGTCPTRSWNREHTWAKSHGDFGTVTGPGTDLFHMRPELTDVNSTRGNLDFDDGGSATLPNCTPCTKDSDSFSPRAAIRGDIARGLFYMAVAYDGDDGFPDLQLNDYTCNAGSKAPNIGKLSTLIRWSLEDPPDALELARNNLIDSAYQHNRNPFIDHPEWVSAIWGDGVNQGPACGSTGTGGGSGGGGTPPENIVISEAYVNGGSSGATYKNKYVELYNPLSSTVDLSPYSLQYRSASGTGVATGIYSFAATAKIAAHHYFVVQLPGNSTGAGGSLPQVDADASSVNPGGASGGTLFLAGTHSAVAPTDDSVGDLVGYGSSNASETSPAPTGYSVTKSLQRNSANSDSDDNSVDFTNTTPTPGKAVDGTGGNPTVSPFTGSSTGSPVDVGLSGSDVYGDALTWSVTAQPDHGSVSISGSTATYTPDAGFSGTDVATVTAANNHGGSTSTSLTVTVTQGNHAPTTSPMSATTDEDTATTVPLSASDEDGDSLSWQVTTDATHGRASVSGSTLTYTPAADFNGQDTVGVTVSDGHGGSASTTVTITVDPVNDAPIAHALTASTARDTATQVTLSGSDVDDSDLTYHVATGPSHGNVSISGTTATYTPSGGYAGPDSFSYTVSDPHGATSSPASVSVSVTATQRAPVPTAVSASTAEDTPVTFTLPATDPDDDPLTYGLVSGPEHGSVSISGNQATYTPAADYNGPDSFTWDVSDGTSTVDSVATIGVTPVNDAPIASDGSATTDEDTPVSFALTAHDVDGDALSYHVATPPSHGSVSIDAASTTYTPNADYHGPDSFTFFASDGSTSSLPATVSITVASVNDAPVATPATATTAEDSPVNFSLQGSDADGDPLTYALKTRPGHGSVSLTGHQVTYTPAADFNGQDSFTWTVSDGSLTSTGTASITVTAVNDAPTASNLAARTDQDGSGVTIQLQGGDVDGDSLTYALGAGADHGHVTVAGDTATYVPDAGYSGPDSFTYTASDGHLTSGPATVSITVDRVNHPPTVSATRLDTTAGTAVSTTLATSDADGDPVAITSLTQPQHGTATFSGTTVTYTPSIRSGTDSFIVTVSDDHGGTATAEVAVTITALTAQLQFNTPAATRGSAVTTTVTATGPSGATPTGTVTLTSGGRTLGTATLDSGSAEITWTPTSAGPVTLLATYAGDDRFDPASSSPSDLTVDRSASRLRISGKHLRAGHAGTIKVAVATVAGAPATGTVRAKIGSKRLTAPLRHGVARFHLARLPHRAKVKVKATYVGDDDYARASASRRLTLKR